MKFICFPFEGGSLTLSSIGLEEICLCMYFQFMKRIMTTSKDFTTRCIGTGRHC